MLNSCTLKESRTWLLVCTRHCYFIPFNHEHPVYGTEGLLRFWGIFPLFGDFSQSCLMYGTGAYSESKEGRGVLSYHCCLAVDASTSSNCPVTE